MILALCAILALVLSSGFAESQTLEQIMSHPDWLGRQPESPYWADDGKAIYYERKLEGSEQRQLFRFVVDSGETLAVAEEDKGASDYGSGDWSSDRSRKVYSRNGDLFVREVATGEVRQLTRTEADETEPFFMLGDDRIAFHREGAIYVRSLASGLESQPAVAKFEDDPDNEPDEDSAEAYLRGQQRRLIDYIREQKEKDDSARARDRSSREADASRVPLPFYLGEGIELKASSLSPSGRYMLLLAVDEDRDDGKHDMMPDYITDSAYVAPREVRTLVGTGTPVSDRVILLNLETHVRADISFESLPGIHEDPLAVIRNPDDGDGEDALGEEERARAVYVGSSEFGESASAGILWSADGKHLVLNIFSHDHKDRWIAEVDLEAGSMNALERISDEAWINWSLNEIAFLGSKPTLYYTSEESGYSQLYLRSLTTDETRRLTHGDFVVSDVVDSPDGRHLYYVANVDHPGIYEVYRYDLQEGRNEQLTSLGGRNAFVVSPNGSSLLLTHSETTTPPELYVQDARPGASATQVSDTVSELFRSFEWVAPEVVAVPSTHHDRPIYSRLYRPTGEGGSTGAAVVFVHGAGYLQNSHLGWSGYFREFMFHTLLTQQGYAVLDMDYRASAGYGRDWRTAIYRQMGTPELEDLEDGVRYLVDREAVDPARVGVYGGSYGGFLTFMALFKEPDLFACGAALRPVTDWAHYNHPYTARILNTPADDPEAYERSSPLEFAEGLSKPLLIAHGMQDNNVFFKDSVRLVQRLIELEKTGWETAIYPVEAHGFREPSSWLDEYRRVYALFERYLGE